MTIPCTKCRWDSLKAISEVRTWVQVIYLGSDPTKHEHPNKKNDIVKEEETTSGYFIQVSALDNKGF